MENIKTKRQHQTWFEQKVPSDIMMYADKITTISCKAYPFYLNQITKYRENFKSLEQVFATINHDDGRYFEYGYSNLHDTDVNEVTKCWVDYTYIDLLLNLTKHVEVALSFCGYPSRLLKPELARYYNLGYTFCIKSLTGTITRDVIEVIQNLESQQLKIDDIALLKNTQKTLQIQSISITGPEIENYDFSKMPLRKIELDCSIDAKSFNSLPISVEKIKLGTLTELSNNIIRAYALFQKH
ncbi:unnamed protein product [Ambrosiozyma monospora]|uniref:Unnamed protein product n=1 Tax=Ambrosiozyma monospora TaxID=43982 RepID=A0ACB5SZD1_AMBMO|nr:unnamed protein product [Ambrosiozyma monospora]